MSYPVFDIANPVESLHQIAFAAGTVLGLDAENKIQFVKPSEGFVEALSTNVATNSERARDLLGWQPRHPSITAGMEVYMRAYLAHQ
jgi:nucleoside-diphosphate-sugar epimerase